MKLILSPQRSNDTVTYGREGTDLLIDGARIDLSGEWVVLEPDAEDEPLEPSGRLLAGERDPATGEITLTVRAPYGPGAPESEHFPEPVTLDDGDTLELPR